MLEPKEGNILDWMTDALHENLPTDMIKGEMNCA
jgi:hypothetical protein